MLFLILAIFFFLTIIVVNTLFFKIVTSLPNCPNCGLKVPAIRKPTSIRQAFWGGWTCSVCNCEINKWGKEIQKESEIKNVRQQIKQSQQDFIKPFDEKGRTPVERIFHEKEQQSENKSDL